MVAAQCLCIQRYRHVQLYLSDSTSALQQSFGPFAQASDQQVLPLPCSCDSQLTLQTRQLHATQSFTAATSSIIRADRHSNICLHRPHVCFWNGHGQISLSFASTGLTNLGWSRHTGPLPVSTAGLIAQHVHRA